MLPAHSHSSKQYGGSTVEGRIASSERDKNTLGERCSLTLSMTGTHVWREFLIVNNVQSTAGANCNFPYLAQLPTFLIFRTRAKEEAIN